jgi:two-component system phosphate regulon sensor histidine kinase PhoR
MIVQQQAQLTISMLPEPFRIRGDRFYWSQIIFNLLENSLKNNPAPGVHIHVSAARQADGSAAISVQDNGVGIAEEALPFIFNRFYRADKSGLIKGTGLGLSIVRHAVEAHGGTISVASEPGVRTVFTIVLPASALCI